MCTASERLERQNRGLWCGKCPVRKQQLCKKRVFYNLEGAGGHEQCRYIKRILVVVIANVDHNHLKSGDLNLHLHGIDVELAV